MGKLAEGRMEAVNTIVLSKEIALFAPVKKGLLYEKIKELVSRKRRRGETEKVAKGRMEAANIIVQ